VTTHTLRLRLTRNPHVGMLSDERVGVQVMAWRRVDQDTLELVVDSTWPALLRAIEGMVEG
jgi:hypothetical protein